MAPFEFNILPRIFLGVGQAKQVAPLLEEMGRRVMVIYNGAALEAQLERLVGAPVPSERLWRQRGEPTVADVDAAVAAARAGACDAVVGIGGGSAIDAAKAVAGLLTNGGSAQDYMEIVGAGRTIAQPAAPWIAVPTTAGTGAEATRNAVIGLPEKHFKASIRSHLLLPRVSVIDPALAVDVPPEVTARSGMDALCQCIEAYTSSGANAMTDPLALDGIRRAGRSLERAFNDGGDLDARQEMAIAALFSGIALTNAGLGAVHGFAAPLGANFPVPHGTVCAALLPGTMRANVAALRAAGDARTVARYGAVGRALAEDEALGDAAAIDVALATVAELSERLGIPRLGTFGITEQDVSPMVALARKASSMKFNPIVLSDEVLAGILRAAL